MKEKHKYMNTVMTSYRDLNKLRRLCDLAAFNIALFLKSESDVDCFKVPINLRFLVTYSAYHIVDQNLIKIKE
jgi:hypothetical protein